MTDSNPTLPPVQPCHCGQRDTCRGEAALLPGWFCKIANYRAPPSPTLPPLAMSREDVARERRAWDNGEAIPPFRQRQLFDQADRAHDLRDALVAAEARVAELEQIGGQMEADFSYLERTFPDLYRTQAGYTLKPRVLELRAVLAGKVGR